MSAPPSLPTLPDAAAARLPSLTSTAERPQPDREPFERPADYEFEPELSGEAPRPIPKFERPGRLERGRRVACLGLLTAGSLCLILAPLPVVNEIGQYFLPLAWLTWIGAGCLLLAAGLSVWKLVSPGPYRYIREGVPVVARVTALGQAPTAAMNGQPTHYAFLGVIEFPDPRFGELRQITVTSSQFPASLKDEYATTFQPGDYVTAIYLPRELEKSIRLYGFLDLNPDVGLVRRGKPVETGGLWKVPLLVAGILGFFGVLCWNIYAYGRYHPVEFEFSQSVWPMAVGGIVLGGAMLAVLWIGGALRVGKAAAAILVLGSLLLGGMTTLCWCFTWNALADDSPGRDELVGIKSFTQTTHNGIVREYTIEYVFRGSDRTYKLMTDPDHIAQFQVPLGLAEIHAGRLGWKWVKTIRPAGVADLPQQ